MTSPEWVTTGWLWRGELARLEMKQVKTPVLIGKKPWSSDLYCLLLAIKSYPLLKNKQLSFISSLTIFSKIALWTISNCQDNGAIPVSLTPETTLLFHRDH